MKCIIYSRVSTTDQTTENQILQLKEYTERQGWDILEVKTDICSGSKSADERAGLKEVFELARRRKFDILLFWSLDRLSREGTRKTLEYLSRLDNYKVKWHSYSEEYISSLGIFADAIISLMACLAKQERLRISDRTKAGLQRAISHGKTLGRPKLNPAIDHRAIELREQGYSFSRIAQELNISKTHAYKLCQ